MEGRKKAEPAAIAAKPDLESGISAAEIAVAIPDGEAAVEAQAEKPGRTRNPTCEPLVDGTSAV